ncbi:FIST N-terminal domain-containing protein [Hydrogenimonas sp.]
MKQWVYKYEGEEAFRDFVMAQALEDKSPLLVQVNCGKISKEIFEEIQSVLNRVLPRSHVVGMSSVVQTCCNNILFKEIVFSITYFEKSRIDIYEKSLNGHMLADMEDVIGGLKRSLKKETKGILLLTNAVEFNVEALIERSNEVMPEIPIFGGIASDVEPFEHFVVFSKSEIYEKEGMVAVLFHGEALNINCGHFFDWEPIGREFVVTKANGRYLEELDGKPLVDIYGKYFGPMTKEKMLHVAIRHPLIRQTPKGPLARAMLRWEGDRGFFTGHFKEGDKVQIGFGHYRRMMERYEMIPDVYTDLPLEVVWFYVCASYLYGYSDIMKNSSEYFKNPNQFFGMLTFGEITHYQKNNCFLNFSLTRVALTEDMDARAEIADKVNIVVDSRDQLLANLSTLVASSTHEIVQLNRHLEEEVRKRTRELAHLNASLERRIALEVKKNREKDKMLFHQSKFAAMGEMINNIAHQWRQPLNIIALVMQDLSLKSKIGNLTPDAVEFAENKIQNTLKYLSDTIDDFRNFASKGEDYTHPGAFEVCNTVRDALRLVSIVLEDERIKLKLSLPEKDAFVSGSPNDLKQILLNLIYNAIDVLKERKVKNPEIGVQVRYNNKINIIVRDNAGGIDSAVLEKIFEPYFTTKHQSRGTGLGLYMSKMIAEKRLNGKISAHNTSHGAAFWIELPFKA